MMPAYAQKIKVSESVEKIANGKNNSLVVSIPEANSKDVVKAWKDKMKGYGSKVSGKKEMFVDNASILNISQNTIDIYAKVESKKNEVVLITAFDLGGAFLNSKSHSDGYKNAEKLIYDFAVEQAKKAIQVKIDEQEKIAGKFNKEIESLTKENEKLNKSIEDYKNRIAKAEKDIEKNKSSIEDNKRSFEKENSTLKDLKSKLNKVE